MTLRNVLRSEWTKLLSLRSTRWTLLALLVSTVGFGMLASYNVAGSEFGDVITRQVDPTQITLAGLGLGQLAIAVLGVLTMSAEYSTGAIRSTFAAVPNRALVLTAKALLVAIVGLALGLITCFASFFAGMAFFDRHHLGVSLGDPGVLRAVGGGGLYVMASGLFGFALGAVLRRTAGALTAAIAGLLILPGLTNLLPGTWGDTVRRYFTSNAGSRVTDVFRTDSGLGPWAGYGVFTAWWVLLLAVGMCLVLRRDA